MSDIHVSVPANKPGWNSDVQLDPNGYYIVLPDEDSKVSIDGGHTYSSIHGLNEVDGHPYNIPATIIYGGLAVLVVQNVTDDFQIFTFPDVTGFCGFQMSAHGGRVQFLVVDSPNPALYADNLGSFNVTVKQTDAAHVALMKKLLDLRKTMSPSQFQQAVINCVSNVGEGAIGGAAAGAALGAFLGPEGAVGGAVIGGGLFAFFEVAKSDDCNNLITQIGVEEMGGSHDPVDPPDNPIGPPVDPDDPGDPGHDPDPDHDPDHEHEDGPGE